MGSASYRLVVEGELGPRYRTAFEGLSLESCAGRTAIVGIVDQAQLQGVVDRVGDLGLKLVSVTQEEHVPAEFGLGKEQV